MDIREKMRREWDRRARIDPRYWVAATQEADEESYLESAERDTAAMLQGLRDRVAADGRVLDLGCGIGRMTAQLAGRFAEVVGVDVSPAMVEQAEALHGGTAGLRFEANNGADLAAFADGSFDLVFSYSVLPHLPPAVLRAYFAEVNRVLRPGGWFRYQFWVGPEARAHAENDTLNIRVYDHETFAGLNRAAGFRVHEVDPIDYFDPVLKLNPVWVNAERVGDATKVAGTADLDSVRVELSDDERALEYGLLVYLAVKHGERGESAEAERVLEEAVATDPTRPDAYVEWAAHRQRRDDVPGALRIFEALTEQAPDEPIGWLYRAQFALICEVEADARAALDRFDACACDDAQFLEHAAMLRSELPAESSAPRPAPRPRKKVKRRVKKKKA